MTNIALSTRDVARELARRYSTMTHEELDVLESILVPMKFLKGELILKEGEVCRNIYWVARGLLRQFYYKNGKEKSRETVYENGAGRFEFSDRDNLVWENSMELLDGSNKLVRK
jgi:CRP-like cAMP-binding protein